MVEILRLLGIMSAAWAIGVLVILFVSEPVSTKSIAKPWRYWAAAAAMIVEVTGLTARVQLWGMPLTFRDVTFLATNICIIVAATGVLLAKPEPPKGGNP